jgi:glycyl-tRNA synthetase beta chain
MANMLLEILSEEIPALMQKAAAHSLEVLVKKSFESHGIDFDALHVYYSSTRLSLIAEGLNQAQNTAVKKKGPRLGAPETAIEGFCRACGIQKSELILEENEKKEVFYYAICNQEQPRLEICLPQLCLTWIEHFAWPKSMRWNTTHLRWIRPIRGVLLLLNDQPLYGSPLLPFAATTLGHITLKNRILSIATIKDYVKQLAQEGKVMVCASARRAKILDQMQNLAQSVGGKINPEPSLLEEVCGLVDWPNALLGKIDPTFLSLPQEVIITSMKVHQKYFPIFDDQGHILPYFIVIANHPNPTSEMIQGYERVLRARLSDALFFWNQDLATSHEMWFESLKTRLFHAKLGSMADKTHRLMALTPHLHWLTFDQQEDLKQAFYWSKLDLSTSMVGEFPELQGKMGAHYALKKAVSEPIAQAIAQHYSPKGPDDPCVQTQAVAFALAILDRMDSLLGLFGAGERPTSSKDPFALRRAALGIIRLVIQSKLSLSIYDLVCLANRSYAFSQETIQDVCVFLQDRWMVYCKEQLAFAPNVIQASLDKGYYDTLDHLMHKLYFLQNWLKEKNAQAILDVWRRLDHIQPDPSLNPESFIPLDATQSKITLDLAKKLDEVQSLSLNLEAHFAHCDALIPMIHTFFDDVLVCDADIAATQARLMFLRRLQNWVQGPYHFKKLISGIKIL